MYGRFLRQVRESRGLTQAEVAEIIGSSQPTVSAYEHDRKMPSADTLNKIVAGCGYLLTASAGTQVIICPTPQAGWFEDEGLPPRDATDMALAAASRPKPGIHLSMEERGRNLRDVLKLADALRRSRDQRNVP
jgi:transcriptional regulator with XRE-family HTH domain